eukprot:Gb_22475 [translate_table: standard]
MDDNLRTEIGLSIEEAIRSPLEEIRVAMGEMVQAIRLLHVANQRRDLETREALKKKAMEDPKIGEGRKGLASQEALEHHVKQIIEEQHFDHQLSELDENDGGVILDFTQINCDLDEFASPKNSMKTSTKKIQEFGHSTSVDGNKSTPIPPYACRTGDGIDKIQEIHLEALANKKLHTYALPTPVGGRSTSVTGGVNNSAIGMKLPGVGGVVNCQWHTSPLEQCNASTKSNTNLCNSKNSISSPLMRQTYMSKG